MSSTNGLRKGMRLIGSSQLAAKLAKWIAAVPSPYQQTAKYTGTVSTDDAENFVCAAEK
jgi:hypothetical protein